MADIGDNYSKPDEIKEKSTSRRREPVVKQLIKNIRLKNYKANEKILEIRENTFG